MLIQPVLTKMIQRLLRQWIIQACELRWLLSSLSIRIWYWKISSKTKIFKIQSFLMLPEIFAFPVAGKLYESSKSFIDKSIPSVLFYRSQASNRKTRTKYDLPPQPREKRCSLLPFPSFPVKNSISRSLNGIKLLIESLWKDTQKYLFVQDRLCLLYCDSRTLMFLLERFTTNWKLIWKVFFQIWNRKFSFWNNYHCDIRKLKTCWSLSKLMNWDQLPLKKLCIVSNIVFVYLKYRF